MPTRDLKGVARLTCCPDESQAQATPSAPVDGDAQIKISQDRMEATMVVSPPRGGGSMVLAAGAKHRLKAASVVFGVMEDAIVQLVERCKRSSETVTGVVARGRAMVPQGPPRWEMQVDLSEHVAEDVVGPEVEVAEADDDEGKKDYHFEAKIPAVEVGQIIAVRHSGTPGRDGRTVLDQPIVATPGKDEFPKPSSGITQGQDDQGHMQYIANMCGKVVVESTRIYVTPDHTHQGDLTVGHGDIVFPANVTIKGNVRDNAVIKAGGDLSVIGRVDGAYIEVGGTMTVSQGIVGGGRGKIVVGGNISANFAEGARIETRGDAEIRRGVMNCDISASGRVIVMQGRGAIIGGIARAGKGIEAKNIGSLASGETQLVVGTDFALLRERTDLEASMENCASIIRRLDHALGPLDVDSDLSKFPAEKRENVRTAIMERVRQRSLLRVVDGRFNEVRARIRDETGGAVRVMGNCFPGVKITIRSSHMTVSEELRFCQILQKEGSVDLATAPL